MTVSWLRLKRELRELEECDPKIKAAREHVEHVTSEHGRWRQAMVRDLWTDAIKNGAPL